MNDEIREALEPLEARLEAIAADVKALGDGVGSLFNDLMAIRQDIHALQFPALPGRTEPGETN